MRSPLSLALACALFACGKKTPPAPEIVATTAPPPVVTSAPIASASASAIVAAIVDASEMEAAAEDDASTVALEDTVDAGVPWVTAQSSGCLGWNPSTHHALCVTGTSTSGANPTMRVVDVFDTTFMPIDWLNPGMARSVYDDDPPMMTVDRVAKVAAALRLTRIDSKAAQKVGVGQELTLTTPKKVTVRYKRTTAGADTTDAIELGCKSSPKPLFGHVWRTNEAPRDPTVDIFVDPTSAIAIILWYTVHGPMMSQGHDVYALGIDFSLKDYCSYYGTLF